MKEKRRKVFDEQGVLTKAGKKRDASRTQLFDETRPVHRRTADSGLISLGHLFGQVVTSHCKADERPSELVQFSSAPPEANQPHGQVIKARNAGWYFDIISKLIIAFQSTQ
jgi:hypothetical protein